MTDHPYEQILEQLSTGQIDSFDLKREDFFLFRDPWLKRPDRKYFKGEAHHGGDITYTYDTSVV